jgi:hypothetical protein
MTFLITYSTGNFCVVIKPPTLQIMSMPMCVCTCQCVTVYVCVRVRVSILTYGDAQLIHKV